MEKMDEGRLTLEGLRWNTVGLVALEGVVTKGSKNLLKLLGSGIIGTVLCIKGEVEVTNCSCFSYIKV